MLSNHAELAHLETTKTGATKRIKSGLGVLKNGVTTHGEQVSPSSTIDNHPEPLEPERMARVLHTNGDLNGFHTPPTPESMESDEPVVIVGMGELFAGL